MSDQVLLTTTVGSFGKPDYLQKARNANARGKLGESELNELERKATEEWVRRQERLDIDILVDGEMYRGDMVAYFAERLDGFRLLECTDDDFQVGRLARHLFDALGRSAANGS